MEMKKHFWEEHGIPNCLGIIDGTHIPIKIKGGLASAYFNYKGFTSINC
jgi:hypothetical protein